MCVALRAAPHYPAACTDAPAATLTSMHIASQQGQWCATGTCAALGALFTNVLVLMHPLVQSEHDDTSVDFSGPMYAGVRCCP